MPKDVDQVNLVKDAVRSSLDRYRGYYDTLKKFHLYYLSATERKRMKPASPGIDLGGMDWRADIFVPYSFSTIETAVPRTVFGLMGSRPYVKAVGRTPDDEKHAEAIEGMLDYDFERAQVLYKSILAFKSFYKYGITIGKVTWKNDFYEVKRPGYTVDYEWDDQGNIREAKTRKIKVTETIERYSGPWFTPVDVFKFYPDPQYYEIQDMRYVAEYEKTDLDKLKHENEMYKLLTGENLYKNLNDLDEIKYVGEFEEISRYIDESASDMYPTRYPNWGRAGAGDFERDRKMVKLVHYWENDRYIVLANGHTIIRDSENPYQDGKKPYFAATCFPTEFQFYGQGLLHPTSDLQEEMNSWRNLVLDQAKLNIMNVWAIDETSSLTDADLAIFPGKVVRTQVLPNGKPTVSMLIPPRSLPPEAQWVEGQIQRDWQTALAINDYIIGAGSGSAGTASEAAMLNASAATRFRLQALIGEERYMLELARFFVARRQQFFDRNRVYRVLGKTGWEYPEIKPEDLQAEFDFMPMGTQTTPNKEVQRQQFITAMGVIGQNPILMQMTDHYEILKQLWQLFDFRFTEKFIVPPPDKVWQPDQENIVLLAGEWVEVTANEDHETHNASHTQALPNARDERAVQMMLDHIAKHNQFLQAMQSAPANAAQSAGNLSGAPMNQEGNPYEATPSMPELNAQAMGGPGGPVA